jgi:cysteine desulfuration protein SufE
MNIEKIIENFAFLDDWEDRYRYLIELGRDLPPLPAADHNDTFKVLGCASQVWLKMEPDPHTPHHFTFSGDSDAHIVKGLVALIIAVYSGKTAAEILSTDAMALFTQLGLAAHLTPQRSNGVRAMVDRIRADAQRSVQLQDMTGR